MNIAPEDRFGEMVGLAAGIQTTVWLSDWLRTAIAARRLAIYAEGMVEKEKERERSKQQLHLENVR